MSSSSDQRSTLIVFDNITTQARLVCDFFAPTKLFQTTSNTVSPAVTVVVGMAVSIPERRGDGRH